MVVPEPGVDPEISVWVDVHEKLVPTTLPDNAIDVVVPVQIVSGEGIADTSGFGFIVIVINIGVPAQVPAVGVTVYITVPTVGPVADKVCDIPEPLPEVAPDAPV